MKQTETDVVSSVLQAIRLDSAFYFNVEFSAPWTVEAPASRMVGPMLSPGAEHVIIYHMVLEGEAWGSLASEDAGENAGAEAGGTRVPLKPGDIVMFPQGDGHVLGCGDKANWIDARQVFAHWKQNGLEIARFGGGGEETKLVCGYFVCEPHFSPSVLGGLPRLLHINIRDDSQGSWLENSIRFSMVQGQASDAGSQAVLAKLAEALFVETVRRHLKESPAEEGSWLAGVRDPDVGRALAALHQDPKRQWTLADLATHIGVSRSVLAERFTRLMGEPLMAYLTKWRLQLGAQMLAGTNHGVAYIAEEVGYGSEAAFNRAFKRAFNVPPARYRSQVRGEG